VSFVTEFDALPVSSLLREAQQAGSHAVRESLARERPGLTDFARLISPAAGEMLETLARRSHALTLQRFGRVIRLFAPLYLSNECINNCRYCGFSRDNPILRVTLTLEEVLREARALAAQGFRSLLLVAGEHPKFVSREYLRQCVAALHGEFASVSLEVGPMTTEDYRPLVEAGADGLFGRLPGNLRPRGLCPDAHRWAETRFQLAHGNSRTRLRGRLPAIGHRRALRAG